MFACVQREKENKRIVIAARSSKVRHSRIARNWPIKTRSPHWKHRNESGHTNTRYVCIHLLPVIYEYVYVVFFFGSSPSRQSSIFWVNWFSILSLFEAKPKSRKKEKRKKKNHSILMQNDRAVFFCVREKTTILSTYLLSGFLLCCGRRENEYKKETTVKSAFHSHIRSPRIALKLEQNESFSKIRCMRETDAWLMGSAALLIFVFSFSSFPSRRL